MQALLLAYSAADEHDEFSSPFNDWKHSRIPSLTAELNLKHSIEKILMDGSKHICYIYRNGVVQLDRSLISYTVLMEGNFGGC